MNRTNITFIALFVVMMVFIFNCAEDTSGVKFIREGQHTVKILIDGQHLTTYSLSPDSEKAVFFPLNSPGGNMINRGFPIVKGVPDESQDHPHHQSFWFTYGDVNGVDFWNEPGDPKRNGKIVPTKVKCTDGKKVGGMVAYADWVMPEGWVALKEEKEVFVYNMSDYRAMDFTIKLTAQDSVIQFGDTKEGMFGLRVTPTLKVDNGAQYLNSDSLVGKEQCWGKRAAWLALTGPVKDEILTIAIFNHPESINFPCFWHARGYGLTAANPFGRKAYTKGAEEPLGHVLEPGESITFKARLMIQSGAMTKDQLDQAFKEYQEM